MLIDITPRNIDDGTPGTCCLCPIARRLEELTGRRWFVTEETASPWPEILTPGYVGISLPDAARAFVTAFDRGERVQPLSFELPIQPTPSEETAK